MIQQFRILSIASMFALAAAVAVPAMADEKPAPQGSVILTVAGKVTNWNRGAMAPARDTLLNQHKITFEKAMAFDATMLGSLPAQELRLTTPAGDGAFGGPSLADVLKAVGAEGAGVRLVSLDGSSVDLSAADIKDHNWMLALSVDGKPVGIGDFGPLWLLHKPASGITPTKEELQRWVWSVFYIEAL